MSLVQVHEGKSIVIVAPSGGLTGGQIYLDGGIFGVVKSTVAAGASAVIDVGGVYDATKAAGTAWADGDLISYNGTAFTKSTTTDVHAVAVLLAGSSATTGRIRLLEAPMVNPARVTAIETRAAAERHTVRIPVTANAAPTYLWAPPFAGTVTGIKVACTTTIASTGGTVLLAGIKVGGNTLLATASTDIEGTVGAAAPATVPLTATAADLVLAATDVVKFTVTSNNADATGGGDLIAIITMTPA